MTTVRSKNNLSVFTEKDEALLLFLKKEIFEKKFHEYFKTVKFNIQSIVIFNPAKQKFGVKTSEKMFRAPWVVTDFSGLIFVFIKDRIKIHFDRNHPFTS